MQQPPLAPTLVSSTQSAGKLGGAEIAIPAGTKGETDQAILSGANASVATGSVTYDLYSNSTCTKLVAAEGTGAVTSGQPAPSKAIGAALAPGRYYWKVTYTGDVSNEAASSTCGGEVLTVTAPAGAATAAAATAATVTLTLRVAGPYSVHLTITAIARGGRTRSLTLATGSLRLAHSGNATLKLALTGAARSLLSKGGGHLNAILTLKTKTPHGTFTTTAKLTITERHR